MVIIITFLKLEGSWWSHDQVLILPEEGVVDLEAAEAGPVGPDMDEGEAGEVKAGAQGEEGRVQDGHCGVAAGQGALGQD